MRLEVPLVAVLCYAAGLSLATDSRIVGGRPATEGEIPYQISLRRSYNDIHFCGGTLVAPNFILTAAHCLYYVWGGLLPPIVVSAVAGQLDLPIKSNSVYRNASAITVHPEYNKTTMSNDLAMIKVEEPFPVENDPLVSTVALRNTSINSGTCIVSGWGVEQYESEITSEVLLAAEVQIFDFGVCDAMYGPSVNLTDGMLCAGNEKGETDACQGDSGGPLICDGLLTGIVSTGSGCGSADYPGIYSDVAKYLPWIESVLQGEEDYTIYSSNESDDDAETITESVSHLPPATPLAPKEAPEPNAATSLRLPFSTMVLMFCILYNI